MYYCDFAGGHPLHEPYHDWHYGYPIRDDHKLFERLVHELMQAGLNWELILRKEAGFAAAFDGFDIDTVAAYDGAKRAELLADPRIIRNRLKVDAVIENARRLQAIRAEHGSFVAWLDAHHPLDKPEWVKLFKRTFRFTGGEITGEFLISTGYLPGAHRPECPAFARILELDPPWARVPRWRKEAGL